jgi:hypothetical protein
LRVLALFAIALLALGCRSKPAAGDKCTKEGRYVCADLQSALYCKSGVFVAVPCKGAKGCSGDKNPRCDYELAAEGDACMSASSENYACSVDNKSGLVCKDGKFVLWRACKGPQGCVVRADRIECDNTYADPGDPCGTAGSFACSVDKKLALVCKEGKYFVDSACRGPEACRVGTQARKLECDDSVANEGDPCDTEREVTCSEDHKSELVCTNLKWTKKLDCTRKDGCVYQRNAPPLCSP